MWFVYGFSPCDPQRATGPEFAREVDAFCAEMREHFGADSLCVAATARTKAGGIEICYRLAARPDDDVFWQARLQARGLSARRVPARA